MRQLIRYLVILPTTFLLVNLSFVTIHYLSDKLVPQAVVEEKILNAFNSGHFFVQQYPFKDFGRNSLYNLNGIDQYSECVNALMSIYRNPEDPLLNAIIPAYPSFEDEQYCLTLKMLLVDKADINKAKINTKARLWFGTRAFTVFMLSKFEIAQLYPLLKQLTYFGFSLLLAIAFSHSIRLGWLVLPFTTLGIFGAGIPYYGGIANALPFGVALYLGVGMALIRRLKNYALIFPYSVAAGSIMSFFYLTDGSLILSISLMVFTTYFFAEKAQKPLFRWRDAIVVSTLFVISFILSFVCKQILAGMVLDFSIVWEQFVNMVAYRTSTKGGPDWNHWQSFYGQIEAYDLAVLWNSFLYRTIIIATTISTLLALILFPLILIAYRQIEDVFALTVFMAIALVVFLRYFLMVNHSYEHWFIVCRYIFILLGTGVSSFIYCVSRLLGNKKPSSTLS